MERFNRESENNWSNQWPAAWQVFEEDWERFITVHPIIYADDERVQRKEIEVYTAEEQLQDFLDYTLAQPKGYPRQGYFMNRHCYFDEHDRSYEQYTEFRFRYDVEDPADFAIQFDKCTVPP